MESFMKQGFARLLVCSVLAAAAGTAWAQAPGADDVVHFEIRRFEVVGNTLLSPAEVEAAVAPFVGRQRDFGDVQRALEALEALYHARGYNVVTVRLPEQELNGGVVRLDVVQTRIGRITVSGNRAFTGQNIRHSLPALQSGHTPQLAQVSANLKLANENPAKKIKLSLEGAQADDEVNARIEVSEQRPWRAMLNLDNSGTDATGKTHAGVVLQHANLLGRDHVGSVQYTTTVEKPEQVAVWGVGYHIPFYALGDSLDLFASYSNVDSGTVNAGLFDLAVAGKGAVYGARYNSILARRGALAQRLVFGLDHKAYKNSVMFAGENFGNDVTVHPLSAAWLGTLGLPDGEANLALTLVQNIAGGSRGGSAAFARVRSSASASWNALRLAAGYTHAFGGDWQARLLANGQYTRDALVPGEQFGAGGSTSVRGFEERELATDSGLLANLELYTPDLCGKAGWQCRALAFYDIAWGERNHVLPGELTRTTIASAGIGLRFAASSAASVQLDYGHTARTGALAGTANNKLHLRVGLAY
jgi:hemolysin activation/secretion protein